MPFWPLEPLLVEWLLSPAMLGILGLLVGSFLNVVIHRVPKMLQRAWKLDSAELLGVEVGDVEPLLTLSTPRSRCPACGHRIAWYENLPVMSYVWLRAKCSACKTSISARYPLVELFTGLLFAGVAWRWGPQPQALLWCAYGATLVALAGIDWDTTLLPDGLTLPFLWAGLVASLMGWTAVTLPHAVAGAVVGYLSLWSVYWLFKLLTGKEGMGYGDFKLLAALGAWLGIKMILPVVLTASLVGAVVGIGMKLSGALREGLYVPFGPFLAGAGLLVMFVGAEQVLGWMGWA